MRVSQGLIVKSAYRELDRNARRLLELEKQAASARRVLRASDDPIAASRIMDIQDELKSLDRFNRNGEFVISWLKVSESSVDQMEQLLERAKEIAVSQSSSTASAQSRALSAKEVELIYDQILHLVNSTYAGRYIFGGTETATAPVERDDSFNPIFNGNDEEIEVRVHGNEKVKMNVTAVEMLKESDILDNLRDLIESLKTDDINGVAEQIDKMESGIGALNRALAQIGIRQNQVEHFQDLMSQSRVDLSETMSQWQDADMALVITELTNQQIIYEAALRTTGLMLNRSTLLDVLG